MEHFVQYHNPEKMGHDCRWSGPLQVFTTNSVKRLPGNLIWHIAGKGWPRGYYLCAVFVVDEVGTANLGTFRYFARGSQGTRFAPQIPLSQESWFPEFRRRLQNFSLGLRAMPEEFVPYFQDLAVANADPRDRPPRGEPAVTSGRQLP